MIPTGKEFALIVASYALGCFASGYYWVRWRTGQDIRQLGSGTVGARNVGRVLGPWGFVITLLLDATKGAAAVGLGTYFGARPDALVAVVLAVVVGHNWPVQLGFRGGKGVAASLGAILAYDPLIALLLVMVFLPVLAVVRAFTLSGLLAFALAPLLVHYCGLGNVETAAVSFLAILVVISHHKNIREEIARLWAARAVKHPPVPPHDGES